jgi:hypothetical protein
VVALCVDAHHEKKTGCQRIGDIFSSIFGDAMDTEDIGDDEDVTASSHNSTRDCHDAMSLEDAEVPEEPSFIGAMSMGASNPKCYNHSSVKELVRLKALWEAGMQLADLLERDLTCDDPLDVKDLKNVTFIKNFAGELLASADAKGMEMGYPGPGNLSKGNDFYRASAVSVCNIWSVTKANKSPPCPRWLSVESARAAIWFFFGGELEKHRFDEESVTLDGLDLRGMIELACVYSMFQLKQAHDVCTKHPAKMCALAVSSMVENAKRKTLFTNTEIRQHGELRSMKDAFHGAGLRGLTNPEFLNSKKLVITFSELYKHDPQCKMKEGVVQDRSSAYLFEPSIKVKFKRTGD